MPQITVWHCVHEDKTFRTKEEYVAHLKELAFCRYHERKHDKYAGILRQRIREVENEVDTAEKLAKFIDDHLLLAFKASCHAAYCSPSGVSLAEGDARVGATMSFNYTHVPAPDRATMVVAGTFGASDLVIGSDHYFADTLGHVRVGLTRLFGLSILDYGNSGMVVNHTFWPAIAEIARKDYARQLDDWEKQRLIDRIEGKKQKPFTYKGTFYKDILYANNIQRKVSIEPVGD